MSCLVAAKRPATRRVVETEIVQFECSIQNHGRPPLDQTSFRLRHPHSGERSPGHHRPDTMPRLNVIGVARTGWLCLAAVLDLATRKIVGWAMRDHMRTELPLAALMMAAQRQRPAPGLICHSDRGSQYAASAYVDYLAAIGATPSMIRTGNCYDNVTMEGFFHTLKVELVHQCRWATQAEARLALFGYIEGYYNRHRLHSALRYLTPEQRMTG